MFSVVISDLETREPNHHVAPYHYLLTRADASVAMKLGDILTIVERAPLWMIYTELRSAFSIPFLFGERRYIMLYDEPVIYVDFDLGESIFNLGHGSSEASVDTITINCVQNIITDVRGIIREVFTNDRDHLETWFDETNDLGLFDLLSAIRSNRIRQS